MAKGRYNIQYINEFFFLDFMVNKHAILTAKLWYILQ